MAVSTKRSITLYGIPRGGDRLIVTDLGHVVATVDKGEPLRSTHALAESICRCMVKLVTPTESVVRVTGIVMTRATDDHDDPILDRLTRMIRG